MTRRYRQPDVSAHQPHAPHPNPDVRVCEVDGQGWPCLAVMLGQRRPVHRYGFRQHDSHTDVERALRRATTDGMASGTLLTIELTIGFEKFGHYETWARGWRVTDPDGWSVEKEYLDDALIAWDARRREEQT